MEHYFNKETQNSKEAKWGQIEAEVEHKVDKRGMVIDNGIKRLVVSLKAHGFGTTGSCEGHLDRGFPYPWVEVESELAEKLLSDPRYNVLGEKARLFTKKQANMTISEINEYEQSVNSQIKMNEEAFERLTLVLRDFYKANPPNRPEGVQLEIQKGPWNQSRIQPKGMSSLPRVKEIQSYWSEEQKAANLAAYRKEIDRFAEFLKQKFFSEK